MKFTLTAATALLLLTSSALATVPAEVPKINNSNTNTLSPQGGLGGAGGSVKSNPSVNNTNNINYPQQVPNIVGPVPRDSVPVLSIYGQLDDEQKGVYGAQISFPLQFR